MEVRVDQLLAHLASLVGEVVASYAQAAPHEHAPGKKGRQTSQCLVVEVEEARRHEKESAVVLDSFRLRKVEARRVSSRALQVQSRH